ncbi:lymphocyte function-associated antigen 3 isoform B [Patagioenas fasciata monilis]|uniref:Lymphocyte function-associated antigen 3 isoform B n=1 Tax=Patagioenas fasciata monilis TaxID=372326 RepID=A0A1V4J313_PATFA|nr:lymphocyte function-associated antigen 3 isoform B [Patagioenas fasciata monilis]
MRLPTSLGGLLFLMSLLGRTKLGTGIAAQKNSPVHGSGEHQLLCPADSQEQPNSHRDISKENSSLLTKHADDCDVNEGEVTGNAEGGKGEHLSNSPSCSKDLKSEANNCFVDQTTVEEEP